MITIGFNYPTLANRGTGLLIDLSSSDFIKNPYAAYTALRAAKGPTWMPHQLNSGTEGIWLFSRYSHVATILRETGTISKDKSRLLPAGRLSALDRQMLRFESPLQRSTFRVTTREFSLGGHSLEPGQQVSAVIGAANRDPHQFPNADMFDITRTPNRHLSFGLGIHKCLGERLARIEARVAFKRLLEKFSHIELVDKEPQWQQKTLFRGLRSLHLNCDNRNT